MKTYTLELSEANMRALRQHIRHEVSDMQHMVDTEDDSERWKQLLYRWTTIYNALEDAHHK